VLLLLAVTGPVQAQIHETINFTGLDKSIPDGDASGMHDVRSVASAIGNISSLQVKLHITGQFNGDL
jgi:hypothetical protein